MIKKLSVLLLMVLFSTEIWAQNVTIRGVRLVGTGCESASAIATADAQILSVLFDNYSAEIGIGSQNPQRLSIQKDCRVLIDVDVPRGYQYALQQTDYRGFANLPASAYGFHRFTQIVPNQPIVSMREAQLRGPLTSNYAVSVAQKPGRYTYSICNQPSQTIELFSQLSVSYFPNASDRSMAVINLDSIDTGVHTTFKLSWRACR